MKLCRHFPSCSGCDLLDLDYDRQLKMKDDYMVSLFQNHKNVEILNIFPSPKSREYRHKVQLIFSRSKQFINLGIHDKNGKEVIDQKECMIQDPNLTEITRIVKKSTEKFKIPIYNPFTNNGNLKMVILRKSFLTKEVLLTLVTNEKQKMDKNFLENIITNTNHLSDCKLIGIQQSYNPVHGSYFAGESFFHLVGKDSFFDKMGDIQFIATVQSFVQVNPYQSINLYKRVQEIVDSDQSILELYSGIGILGLMLAKKSRKVMCVDSNPVSIELGIKTRNLNEIENVDYKCMDSADFTSSQKYDTYILDPPRMGLHYKVIRKILKEKPEKLIYISCNPLSLEQNAFQLKEKYTLNKIFPFDMFPHTNHIETIAEFIRKN